MEGGWNSVPTACCNVTIGDTGQQEYSQDLDDLRGSLLRVTPEGEVPADNPWPNNLIWVYGLRNVHGLAFSS